MSPYVYCAGNPVNLVDPDGRVVCDSDGNVVFTPNPNATPFVTPTINVGTSLGINTPIQVIYQEGTIMADDGTPIQAFQLSSILVNGVELLGNEELMNRLGTTPSNGSRAQEIIDAVKSNCHGTAYAKGQVVIFDEVIASLIVHDGYVPTSNPISGDKGTLYRLNSPMDPTVNFSEPFHSILMEKQSSSYSRPTFTVDDKQEKTQYNLFFEEATAGFYFPVYRNIIWYTKRR